MITDLEKVDPRGRLDVLAYRLGEHFSRRLEQAYGLDGIWDSLKPHVNTVATKYLSNVELPTEAKIILSIIQANQRGIT